MVYVFGYEDNPNELRIVKARNIREARTLLPDVSIHDNVWSVSDSIWDSLSYNTVVVARALPYAK